MIYSHPALRPRPHALELNEKTQSALWAYGIGGDLPILVVRIGDARDLPLVRQALHAHEYLRAKRFTFDLVILNDHPPSHAQSLQEALLDLVRTSNQLPYLDKSGGVFLRRSDLMPDADRILLHTVARAVFVTERGTLEDQLERSVVEPELPPAFIARWASRSYAEPTPTALDLEHFNELGGFTHDGCEYVIRLGEGQWTPAPWLNIVANEKEFGFQISESGAGFTWSLNSHENRLTPMDERRRERRARRSHLPARRRHRLAVDADAAPGPRSRALHDSSRTGLHSIRAHEPRHRSRTARLRTG
jgi:cyclic beta-1,2-glucan synthetase